MPHNRFRHQDRRISQGKAAHTVTPVSMIRTSSRPHACSGDAAGRDRGPARPTRPTSGRRYTEPGGQVRRHRRGDARRHGQHRRPRRSSPQGHDPALRWGAGSVHAGKPSSVLHPRPCPATRPSPHACSSACQPESQTCSTGRIRWCSSMSTTPSVKCTATTSRPPRSDTRASLA